MSASRSRQRAGPCPVVARIVMGGVCPLCITPAACNLSMFKMKGKRGTLGMRRAQNAERRTNDNRRRETHRQNVSARRRAYGPGCDRRKMSCPRRYFCSIKWRLSRLNGFVVSSRTSSPCGRRLGSDEAGISYEMSPSFRTPMGFGGGVSPLRTCLSLLCAIPEVEVAG